MDLAYLILGLALLVGAGDALVRGAVALSLRLSIPAIIVSATVVAFGTSAPELLISIKAALEDAPGLALGNVVGSNIANVLLVLGVPALIAPLAGCGTDAHRNLYFMIAATVVFSVFVLSGAIVWWSGLILLGLAIVMVIDSLREGLRATAAGADLSEELADLEDVDPDMAPWKIGTTKISVTSSTLFRSTSQLFPVIAPLPVYSNEVIKSFTCADPGISPEQVPNSEHSRLASAQMSLPSEEPPSFGPSMSPIM